ncbi:hypothetical protein ACROAE_03520 [Shewanella sp. MF05960]
MPAHHERGSTLTAAFTDNALQLIAKPNKIEPASKHFFAGVNEFGFA